MVKGNTKISCCVCNKTYKEKEIGWTYRSFYKVYTCSTECYAIAKGVDGDEGEEGEWITFHSNGQIMEQGTHGKDGKRIGVWERYDSGGERISKDEYDEEGRHMMRYEYGTPLIGGLGGRGVIIDD